MLRPLLAWLIVALSAESSATCTSSTVTKSDTARINELTAAAVSSFTSLDSVASCFSRYESFLNASGTPVVTTTTATDTFFTFSGSNHSGLTTATNTITFTTTVVPTPYIPPSECFTGCVIDVDKVQLIYWPTPRPQHPATQTDASSEITNHPTLPLSVVVEGSTLVSPSNYLVFTNLVAQACPLGNSPCTTIGTPVALTTLAFGQNALSTELCQHVFSGINYADFNYPIPWSVVSTQPGCTLILTETHDPASPDFGYTLNPNILFPDQVRTAINPLWASCSFVTAAYDPPSALVPVPPPTLTSSSLAVSSTPPAQSPSSSPPAESSPADLPTPSAESSPASLPANSSPASLPNHPTESLPADANPPPGASLPTTAVNTPPSGEPTGVNNNENHPTTSQNAGSDMGSGGNTAVVPNDPSGTEAPAAVTVSMIMIVTTSGAVAESGPDPGSVSGSTTATGTGSELANVGGSTTVAESGSDSANLSGSISIVAADGSSTNGMVTAAPTVVRSEVGVVLCEWAVFKSVAIALLFVALF